MIKFIYFDLGGVVYTEELIRAKISEELNVPFSRLYEVFKQHGRRVLVGEKQPGWIWNKYKEAIPEIDFDLDDFNDYWAERAEPIQETHDLMHELIKQYPLGIITNTYPNFLETAEKYGIIPDLDYSVILRSDHLGFAKPDSEIFELAEEKSGVQPQEILFIDNGKRNIQAAKDRGWHTVFFHESSPQESIEEIQSTLDTTSRSS